MREADSGLTGRCHCGAVTVRIPRKPDMIAHCNCSLCTAVGWRGIYFGSDEIEIEGAFDRYRRSDIAEPMIDLFRCEICGMATYWTPLTEPPHKRVGLNAHLFDETALAGVKVMPAEGKNWKR